MTGPELSVFWPPVAEDLPLPLREAVLPLDWLPEVAPSSAERPVGELPLEAPRWPGGGGGGGLVLPGMNTGAEAASTAKAGLRDVMKGSDGLASWPLTWSGPDQRKSIWLRSLQICQ